MIHSCKKGRQDPLVVNASRQMLTQAMQQVCLGMQKWKLKTSLFELHRHSCYKFMAAGPSPEASWKGGFVGRI